MKICCLVSSQLSSPFPMFLPVILYISLYLFLSSYVFIYVCVDVYACVCDLTFAHGTRGMLLQIAILSFIHPSFCFCLLQSNLGNWTRNRCRASPWSVVLIPCGHLLCSSCCQRQQCCPICHERVDKSSHPLLS